MKSAYQIDEQKAIDRFRSYMKTNPGDIQLVLSHFPASAAQTHGS